jgi:hypothetical protein
MLNLKARIAAAATVAAASLSILGATAPADAASLPPLPSADFSTNWAGYFSVSSKPIAEAEVTFVVPKVNCAQSRGATKGVKPPYQGVMWVGIGGINGQYGGNSGTLKQDGIVAYCASLKATPVFYPFWEVVPGKPSPVQFSKNAQVHPGAEITAQVYAPSESPVKGKWYFAVTSTYNDVTSVWTASAAAPTSSKNYTAEAITERNTPGFMDLGKVTYTGADYYTGVESVHSITAKRLTLVNNKTLRDPIVLTSSASQPPGDDLKDSFSTSYAPLWTLWVH